MLRVLVLGAGPVGTELCLSFAAAGGCRIWATWRMRFPKELQNSGVELFKFNHMERGHLERLEVLLESDFSPGDCVVWTFPAGTSKRKQASRPEHDAEAASLRLGTCLLRRGLSVCVLSSVSCYVSQYGLITEESVRDFSWGRFAVEEELRKNGAMILPLAGLFGGARVPLQWVQSGRVADLERAVNLISHRDVAHVLQEVAREPRPGELVNVSTGQAWTWGEILAQAGRNIPLQLKPCDSHQTQHGPQEKRIISNQKLMGMYRNLREHVFELPWELSHT